MVFSIPSSSCASFHSYVDANKCTLTIDKYSPYLQKFTYSNKPVLIPQEKSKHHSKSSSSHKLKNRSSTLNGSDTTNTSSNIKSPSSQTSEGPSSVTTFNYASLFFNVKIWAFYLLKVVLIIANLFIFVFKYGPLLPVLFEMLYMFFSTQSLHPIVQRATNTLSKSKNNCLATFIQQICIYFQNVGDMVIDYIDVLISHSSGSSNTSMQLSSFGTEKLTRVVVADVMNSTKSIVRNETSQLLENVSSDTLMSHSVLAVSLPTVFQAIVPFLEFCGSHITHVFSILGQMHSSYIQSIPNIWIIIFHIISFFIIIHRGYQEDSLLVIHDLGVQLHSTGPFYLFGSSTTFLPKGEILDILIQEAFQGFHVKFFLIIVVANDRNFKVCFPNVNPRRAVVEKVWKSARKCLFDEK